MLKFHPSPTLPTIQTFFVDRNTSIERDTFVLTKMSLFIKEAAAVAQDS